MRKNSRKEQEVHGAQLLSLEEVVALLSLTAISLYIVTQSDMRKGNT